MDGTRFLVKYGYMCSIYFFWFGVCLIHLEGSVATQVYEIGTNGSVDLSYRGEMDNIEIFRIYNTSLGTTQYILRTEKPISDVDIIVSSLSPCRPYTFTIEDVSFEELYIPSLGHNISLYENCSYQIELKVNRHTMDIINYVSDIPFVNTSNTTVQGWTVYLRHIYNNIVDKTQYVFKWKDLVESYGIRIYSDEDVAGCGNGTPYYVEGTTAEIHIPEPHSDFELHEGCKYTIEIIVNDQVINVTNVISGNFKVERVLLETIYNESIHKIQYVIRWKGVAPDEYKIDIINKEPNVTYCNKYFQEVFNSSHTELHIPPTKSYDFSLKGECKYIVELKYDEEITKILTDIPACVGPLCNCEILSPQPENIPQIEHGDFIFNVSWSFPENEMNNITDYGFFLFDNGDCNSSGKKTKVKPAQLSKNFAVLNKKDLKDGACLSVSFNNSFLCTYTDTFTYLANDIHIKLDSESPWMYWIIGIVLLVAVVVISNYCFRSRKKKCFKTFGASETEPVNQNSAASRPRKQEVQNLLYVEQEILYGIKDKYEFPRAWIEPLREIGKGAFGEVLLAVAIIDSRKRYVAVKRLRANPTHEELEDFASEIDILKKIGYHQNIIRLIGCCTLEEPHMMIMEYVPCGDLKQYLLDLRNQWQKIKKSVSNYSVFTSRSSAYIVPETPDSPTTPQSKISATTEYMNLSDIESLRSDIVFSFEIEKVLDHKELQSFALQIAKGMEHLEKIPITHRDLAARNILISEQKVLKISDFGLSRKGPYINNKAKKLPLRWMAIESIEDHVYDNKSDVWSFAVVLWEIATLGAFPYEKTPDSMLHYYLQNGERLCRPEICTDELYNLMLRCWSRDKNLRPSFSELVDLLDVKKRRVYVDFGQLNPLYVFPPTSGNSQRYRLGATSDDNPKYLECV